MSKDRIGIIGHFGGDRLFLDGQTVKTKTLYYELKNRGFEDIVCVDTYLNNTNKLLLMWKTIGCVLSCKKIIILLSCRGMRVYFPLMYWVKKLFKRRIYHDVIGGSLDVYVKKYSSYKKYLSSMDGNWVETNKLKTSLEAYGLHNCTVIPNFKNLNSDEASVVLAPDFQNRFCMFSRVMKEKGTTDAIEAICKYNATHEEKAYLNIWGPVEEEFKEEFHGLLEKASEFVTYHGCVDYSRSVACVTNHLALLFPTRFGGEGLPGTIVDAYISALPVIASDVSANSELISEFETGWVYPNSQVDSLCDSIQWAMSHKQEMLEMRQKCLTKAKEFEPDKWMDRICSILNSED